MANIQTRKGKDGKLTYRVQVRLAGFPPQTASFERKTDAKAWATKTEASLREGRHFASRKAKRHTLAELADRYLESVARKKPHALGKQQLLMGWWKDELGAHGLGNITPAMIAEKRDQLLAENIGSKDAPRYRSPSTANRYLAALSKAMSDAVREWHWLHENPVRRVTKETEPGGRVRYLSEEEKNRLLEACRSSPLRELELIVLIALTTGMRRGEIQALRWADIDMKRAQAVIHKTKNRERRGAPLIPQVLELLRAHRKARLVDSELVFPQVVKNAPIDPAHWFERACREAKIEDFRFHDLRHTAASYLAMSGATPAEIAAVLGHKTLAMVKRYAHLSDAHTSAVVERMVHKFFR